MAIDAISSAQTASLNYTPGADRVPKKTLGQAEFFKLLATQLSAQDPLKPMEDTDFIAQMSNFSSLEMMSQLTGGFNRFTEQQDFVGVQNMLGRNVTLLDHNADLVSGIATGVRATSDGAYITIDGSEYPVSSILSVELASAQPAVPSNPVITTE